MELKLFWLLSAVNVPVLLIVPYGIETLSTDLLTDFVYLLIVPYGIETTEK